MISAINAHDHETWIRGLIVAHSHPSRPNVTSLRWDADQASYDAVASKRSALDTNWDWLAMSVISMPNRHRLGRTQRVKTCMATKTHDSSVVPHQRPITHSAVAGKSGCYSLWKTTTATQSHLPRLLSWQFQTSWLLVCFYIHTFPQETILPYINTCLSKFLHIIDRGCRSKNIARVSTPRSV